MKYTNEQIMENRRKWIDFLKLPETKKGKHALDKGNGLRCCLGHGCYVLGIEPVVDGEHCWITYDKCESDAPQTFVAMVGLYTNVGDFINVTNKYENYFGVDFGEYGHSMALAPLNDGTSITPQEIGAWLETVIEGGEGTPFIKLGE